MINYEFDNNAEYITDLGGGFGRYRLGDEEWVLKAKDNGIYEGWYAGDNRNFDGCRIKLRSNWIPTGKYRDGDCYDFILVGFTVITTEE